MTSLESAQGTGRHLFWSHLSPSIISIQGCSLSVMNIVAVKLANNNWEIPFFLHFKHQRWMYVYTYIWMDVCTDIYIFTNKYLHIYIINKPYIWDSVEEILCYKNKIYLSTFPSWPPSCKEQLLFVSQQAHEIGSLQPQLAPGSFRAFFVDTKIYF